MKLRILLLAIFLAALSSGRAATLVASYSFNGSLAAQESGVPALVSVDPLASNTFQTATVFGQTRNVFFFGGNASPPVQQGGLSLDTTGLIRTNNYSVEMVFQFYTRAGAWRRILDVQNRTSDNGFYVSPANNLQVYPISQGPSNFVNNVFHHVVLTDNAGTIKTYLDGALQFTISNITYMDINNSSNLMNLFIDNTVAGGQGEYSPGQIALFRVYDGVLEDDAIAALAGTQLPRLYLQPQGTNVILSWTTNAVAYHLESTGNVASTSSWQTVATSPFIVGTNFTVTNAVNGSNEFFRLKSP